MRSETEALLLYLALAQKDCPEEVIMKLTGRVVLPRHHSESCICKGTGEVRRFPTLRQRQEYHHDCLPFRFCNLDAIRMAELGDCQGRGWVPVDSLEATLAAFRETEMLVLHIYLDPDPQGGYAIGADGWNGIGGGATPNEAAILALYEVVQKEKHGT